MAQSKNFMITWSLHYLPFATLSYENFKDQVALGNEDLIGAVFCTKNYKAAGHVDKNWSEYAIGYIHEEGIVNEGHFFYPEYGIAIEMHQILYGVRNQKLYMVQLDLMLSWEPDTQQLLL